MSAIGSKTMARDITYIPMAKGFVYLVAVIDWFSRKVLSWKLSISLDTAFCIEAVEEALACYGKPEIFNSEHRAPLVQARCEPRLAVHQHGFHAGAHPE